MMDCGGDREMRSIGPQVAQMEIQRLLAVGWHPNIARFLDVAAISKHYRKLQHSPGLPAAVRQSKCVGLVSSFTK